MKTPVLLVSCLALALPAALRADVLYSQAPDFQYSSSSQNDTNPSGFGNYATSYDNFTLAAASSISTVQWTGAFFSPDAESSISSFNISFYADDAGMPGALLSSSTIAGNAHETAAGPDGDASPSGPAAVSWALPAMVDDESSAPGMPASSA